MKRIILASSSPRRQEILNKLGLSFEVVVSNFEENNPFNGLPPEDLVQQLARGKAEVVARQHPATLVIAADTIVVLDGKVLGKPDSNAETARMIKLLAGKSHEVYTAFALAEGSRMLCEVSKTTVWMRDISEAEIETYAQTGEGNDKAGGYGIQDRGALFIEKIDGDYYSVVGLPVSRLANRLKEFGIDLLQATLAGR